MKKILSENWRPLFLCGLVLVEMMKTGFHIVGIIAVALNIINIAVKYLRG